MSDTEPPRGPRRPPRPDPQPIDDASIWADAPPERPSRSHASIDAPTAGRAPQSSASPPTAAPHRTADRSPSAARPWIRLVAVFAAGALIGAGVFALARQDDAPDQVSASKGTGTTTSAAAATTIIAEASETAPDATAAPTTAVPTTAPPPGTPDPMALAGALAPLRLPSDCPLPLGDSESLPNADRAYRGGVHEGIDFICGERGRSAVTPLGGQVLVADASFVDPSPEARVEILDIAKQIGHTPPWTLAMLFGRFVVIDHGIVPNVGHVVTIYAHLEEIDPAIKPGHRVEVGDRIGEIGNAGTESAGTGENRPQALHLHWEIHIDERFLGEGASAADTSAIYGKLFGR